MDNRFIILIGSYNNSEWVKNNIESILTQTHTNFKIIYYDACSTDNTYELVNKYKQQDKRVELFTSSERHRKTWFFKHSSEWANIEDNDIVCIVDGDDFLANEYVLEYLNEVYNKCNCWITYGGMVVWSGSENVSEPFPQNSLPPQQVFDLKQYRKDMWRYSHMRTCKGFLWKRINSVDLISVHDNEYMTLDDLSTVYSMLEMSPAQKIHRVTEQIYIWNNSKETVSRGCSENKVNNIGEIYESEIRSRPSYKELSIVSPTLAGGLGNQMFEVAAAASLAKDNNALLLVNPSEHILPNQGRNINTYITNVFSKLAFDNNPPIETIYNWESMAYKPIPYTKNVKLGGHYQSYKYFDHNKSYIQDLFSNLNIIYELNQKYNTSNTVGVHVRRGDYQKFPDHHPMLSLAYYDKAISKTNCNQAYIFSDDIEWCKRNLIFNISTTYIKEEDYKELYLMSICKDIIISNSSFGWWAAYLNRRTDSKIFAPSTWFGKALINEGFNINDLIPTDWIKI